MFAQTDRALAIAAVAHMVIAVVCAIALAVELPPITGLHPAWKPLKFALSIGLMLGTFSVLVPALDLAPLGRRVLAWTLISTLGLEMILIAVQAGRGTTSHFNTATSLDTVVWRAMAGLVLVATLAFVATALVATFRPLGVGSAPAAFAWRAGLWLLLLSVASGVAMASRGRHTVGGEDGGDGMAVVNWSTTHGDLRIPHFVAMHGLQLLPIVAALLARSPLSTATRWGALVAITAAYGACAVWTLARALAGAPPL